MPAASPKIRFQDAQIEMAHGAGGKASRRLIEGLFAPILFGSSTEPLGDAAHIGWNGARLAITADSFVVSPLSFPGGSIGELAVNGTVNDLAVSGARAEALVVTYVLEAGLPTEVLEAEVRAMDRAARAAGVAIVGGDTKVVEHGKADRMYITTAGVGRPIPGVQCSARSARPGDIVLLSGPIGDHGITILLARGELDLEADLCSDTRPVLALVESLAQAAAPGVRWMRDPTRGGVATALNEFARDCRLGVFLFEDRVPVRDTVRGACELLGLDPLHIANEGQFLAVVAPEYADAALEALQHTPGGHGARMIGEVREQPSCAVLSSTPYGGSRIVDMLVGDPLPRALHQAHAVGALTLALPGGEGDYYCNAASPDPFIHQEVVEMLYHTLWETVHVFLERREQGLDSGEAGFLYPFLGTQKQDTDALIPEVANSILMKVGDDGRLRARMAAECSEEIVGASAAIASRLARGGKLILFGNGGSATDANDWALDCVLPPPGLRPVPAVSLSMEPASITAVANDVGTELIFLRQLIAQARPEDVAIGISTSGGSRNIVMALEEARKRKMLTVALLGYDGGEIRRGLADFALVVPCDYIPRIQEVQASVYHVIRVNLEAFGPSHA